MTSARCLTSVADPRVNHGNTWEQFLDSPRLPVLEHDSRIPLRTERDEAHQYGNRVLSHLRQPPSHQLRPPLNDNRLDDATLSQFPQPEGEHPGCESWKRSQNLVESLYLEECNVSQDEKGPLLSQDAQTDSNRAILEGDRRK